MVINAVLKLDKFVPLNMVGITKVGGGADGTLLDAQEVK